MRKYIMLAGIAAMLAACNNGEQAATTESTAADSTTAAINYAYLPANHPPDNWDRGNMENAALVLQSLKDWEEGNIDKCLTAFADSVQWVADGMDQKMSKEELKKMLEDYRNGVQSVKISMDDYESVISKDKQSEYVGMWYKEVVTDKSGKMDSAYYMDDALIKNGKIALIDSKHRRFPAK